MCGRNDLMHDLNDNAAELRQVTERAQRFRDASALINEQFTYHAPSPEQARRYDVLRTAAREFAHVILATTPVCADQSAAIRKLREAVMTANAAIALEATPTTDGRA